MVHEKSDVAKAYSRSLLLVPSPDIECLLYALESLALLFLRLHPLLVCWYLFIITASSLQAKAVL